jgi:hypothetical protein
MESREMTHQDYGGIPRASGMQRAAFCPMMYCIAEIVPACHFALCELKTTFN